MDTNIFRYFIAIEKHRSFASAAKELFITPQGLSSAVRRMEAEMGVPLVSSQSGELMLTEYGKIVADSSHRVAVELEHMHEDVQKLTRLRSSRISLVSAIGLIDCMPADAVKYLEGDGAACLQTVELMPDYLCEQGVASGIYDYGLLPQPISHPELVDIPVYSDYLFAWVPRGNPLYGKDRIYDKDLAGQNIIFSSNDPNWSAEFLEYARSRLRNVHVKPVDEMFMVLRSVSEGKGIGMTTRSCVESVDADGVQGILLADQIWGFSLCHRKDRILTETEREFIARMRKLGRFHA